MPRSPNSRFRAGLEKAEKMEHIQTAAMKVFGRLGYRKATVQDIIAEAGISRRTFYAYFKSKEDVLVHLLDRFENAIKLAKDPEMPDELDSVAEMGGQLTRLADALFPVILDNLDLIKLLFEGLVMDDDVLGPRSRKIHETFRNFIREYVELARAKGFLYEMDPEIVSVMLIGTYMEAVRVFLLTPSRVETTTLIREILTFVSRGLVKSDALTFR